MADVLEEELLKELKDAFESNDRTAEGSVSMSNVPAVLRAVGHPLSEPDLRKLLIRVGLDPDQKPRVDFDMMCGLLVLKMRGADVDDEADVREAFFVLSRGSDGSHVTHAELKQTLLLLDEEVNDEEVDDMLRHADFDRDGVVNWDDFKRIMTFDENGEKDLSFIRLLSASSAKSRASRVTTRSKQTA